jgi:hypothetical protein
MNGYVLDNYHFDAEKKYKKGLKFHSPEPIFVVTGKVGLTPKVRENHD